MKSTRNRGLCVGLAVLLFLAVLGGCTSPVAELPPETVPPPPISEEPPRTAAGDAYDETWMFDLFDIGGSMELGLVMNGDEEYDTYTISYRQYAEHSQILMSDYVWTPAEPPAESPRQSAPYYITVRSADGGREFAFFDGSDLVCYSTDGVEAWYTLQTKRETGYSLSESMRWEYDGEAVSYARIAFRDDGTPEQTAERFVKEIYAEQRLRLPPGGAYSILDYRVVDWDVTEVSKDKVAILGSFQFAVVPPDFPGESSALWAGNTGLGEGEWEGWLVMGREFVLQKQKDGLWHCIGFGTGGYRLPEEFKPLPIPTADMFGFWGVEAALFDAAIDHVWLNYVTLGECDAVLPRVGTFDTYEAGENLIGVICWVEAHSLYGDAAALTGEGWSSWPVCVIVEQTSDTEYQWVSYRVAEPGQSDLPGQGYGGSITEMCEPIEGLAEKILYHTIEPVYFTPDYLRLLSMYLEAIRAGT